METFRYGQTNVYAFRKSYMSHLVNKCKCDIHPFGPFNLRFLLRKALSHCRH